ncbi:hypothetical protein [Desulfatitalea alkaliphila]|uniref:Uncharacterized protein n=1 Tax=Desulfatitalea alkaliphila TaxID=2929485 RepID=A0AA41UIM2_9BACT|nr:hypothetical protein [Desulfatitalea alkaliphila]MCJ8500925.1 hypothetical protein [Desulfatitalea alkaliphila]
MFPRFTRGAVGALMLGWCYVLPAGASLNQPADTETYADLLVHLDSRRLEAPLLLLADQADAFDPRQHQENVGHLNQNQALLQQIRDRLPGDNLHWKLAGASRRLLAVPEQRPSLAALFERYCRQAVDHTLARTRLPDPYRAITTLDQPVALASENVASGGVAAYLVHKLADEYSEEFHFFNPEIDGDALKITLRRQVFSGKIGSYTSRVILGEDGRYQWLHEPYTLWQNNAQDPLNVLVAPVEETLHILLRPATAQAIDTRLALQPPQSLDDLQQVVDEWMAVEEAVVGGLVARLMPEIFERLLARPLDGELARSLANRSAHAQYRYLQEGIRVVARLGLLPTVALYQARPLGFKGLLSLDGEANAATAPSPVPLLLEGPIGDREPSS